MLTKFQEDLKMMTFDERLSIEKKLADGISEKELCDMFPRNIYVSEGTHSVQPIGCIPRNEQQFVDSLLSIQSHNDTAKMLFNLVVRKCYGPDNLFHEIWAIEPNNDVELTDCIVCLKIYGE